MNINYLTYEQIDLKKWDQCIKRAVNGSIFGYSWFLNIVSPGWGALVDENYENVMPITYQTWLGIKLMLQPCFAPNLGVYCSNVLDKETVTAFIEKIPEDFRYVNIRLNKHNRYTGAKPKILDGVHYELDLIEDYYKIRSRYSKPVCLALSESAEKKITIVPGLNSISLTRLIVSSSHFPNRWLFHKRYKHLSSLVSTAVRYRIGKVYGAYTPNNQLCAAAFFIWSHQRATLLALAVTKKGRSVHALEAIIDEFIRTHAEESMTLRFDYATRSKFESIYKGFGAKAFGFIGIRVFRLWKK